MNGYRHAFGNLFTRRPEFLFRALRLQEPDLPVRLATDAVTPVVNVLPIGLGGRWVTGAISRTGAVGASTLWFGDGAAGAGIATAWPPSGTVWLLTDWSLIYSAAPGAPDDTAMFRFVRGRGTADHILAAWNYNDYMTAHWPVSGPAGLPVFTQRNLLAGLSLISSHYDNDSIPNGLGVVHPALSAGVSWTMRWRYREFEAEQAFHL